MKLIKIFVVAVFLLGLIAASAAFIHHHQKKDRNILSFNSDSQGFAVVELFTSEGCSSCPPADQLVAKLEKENPDNPIYVLSYHVDYWDRLGWKDRFSDAAYTQRQNRYAAWLNLQSIYTPQIVVNGKTEFVGSNETALRKAIADGLQQTPGLKLVLKANVVDDQINIAYEIAGSPTNSDLVIALVQKSAQTKVGGGENSGRTLSHVQIVRKLLIEPLRTNSGNLRITLTSDYNDNKWELIGFIQNEKNGVLQSAAKSELTSLK